MDPGSWLGKAVTVRRGDYSLIALKARGCLISIELDSFSPSLVLWPSLFMGISQRGFLDQ